jgi:hypothetical protein
LKNDKNLFSRNHLQPQGCYKVPHNFASNDAAAAAAAAAALIMFPPL